MNILLFTILVALGAFVAGLLGAMTGLGGGVVLVPLLTLAFHVDIRYAAGASLVSVIATSSGAAAAYVKDGYSNVRIGMFLEIATTFGALLGAFLAAKVPTNVIAIIFGLVLLYSAYLSNRRKDDSQKETPPDRWATRLRMDGSFPVANRSNRSDKHEQKSGKHGTDEPIANTSNKPEQSAHEQPEKQAYHVHNVPGGFTLMFVAGGLSGLLGIGSGAVKVLAMDQVMGIPFKVSTTTSNFMIGVTAAASAGIYLSRGYIDPGLAMPVMLGVLTGSLLGARLLVRTEVKSLRLVFSLVILALALEMIFNGITKRL